MVLEKSSHTRWWRIPICREEEGKKWVKVQDCVRGRGGGLTWILLQAVISIFNCILMTSFSCSFCCPFTRIRWKRVAAKAKLNCIPMKRIREWERKRAGNEKKRLINPGDHGVCEWLHLLTLLYFAVSFAYPFHLSVPNIYFVCLMYNNRLVQLRTTSL